MQRPMGMLRRSRVMTGSGQDDGALGRPPSRFGPLGDQRGSPFRCVMCSCVFGEDPHRIDDALGRGEHDPPLHCLHARPVGATAKSVTADDDGGGPATAAHGAFLRVHRLLGPVPREEAQVPREQASVGDPFAAITARETNRPETRTMTRTDTGKRSEVGGREAGDDTVVACPRRPVRDACQAPVTHGYQTCLN
jgi:hypothetical protein